MKNTKIFLFTLLAIFSLSFIASTTNVAQAGTGSGSVTVTVTPLPVVSTPTASLTADSYSLPYNGSTILHISGTNASYCILSWPGGSNTQGLNWNYTTPALTATTTYKLACGDTKADEVSDSKIITVAPAPNCTITTDTNYNTAPCSGICTNGATNYSTCTLSATGTLSIIPSSCTILSEASTCTTTGATWTTANATSPALVDANMNTTLSTLANKTTALKVWVAYPKTVFNLKDGANILDTKTITASCTTGTSWDGSKCTPAPNCTITTDTNYNTAPCSGICTNGAVNYSLCTVGKNNVCLNGATNPPTCTTNPTVDPNGKCLNGYTNPPTCTTPPAGMSGILNAYDCIIPIGQSSCSVPFNWSVTNPEKPGQSAVTIPVNKTVGTGDTGNNSITLPYNNSTTLYLYNNAKKLDQKNVKSIIDTTTSQWNPNGGPNGTGIVEALPQQGNQNNNGNNPVPPLPLPIITSFNIMSNGISALSPKTIRYNTRVNIDWTSTDAVSCTCTSADKKGVAGATCGNTVNNNPGSFQTLPLKKSMIFTLSCLNGNGVPISESKTVTVDDINTIYKEN